MKKYILILILAFCCFGFGQSPHLKVLAKKSVCAEDYAPSLTADVGRDIGATNTREFNGFIYTPATNKCVCYVDVYIKNESGDPTGINYHLSIHTIDGSSQLESPLGVSSAIAGADINGQAATWISANAGTFDFSTCVSLTASTSYAFAIFPDQDSNLTDDPEIDGTNYWQLGLVDENNGSLIHSGRYTWSYTDPLPHVVQSTDAEDDILVKIGNK
jgi:hypothetical protein